MSNERVDSRDIISDYIFYSKYSRVKPDGKKETWEEAVSRVMEMHYQFFDGKIKEENKDAFNKVFQEAWVSYNNQEILGSQRSLQYGGPQLLKNNFRSFNCSGSYCNRIEFFKELMELLLSGCGTGFSVQKVHIEQLPIIKGVANDIPKIYSIIEDSIEGWANSVGDLIEAYYKGCPDIEFDYSQIRPEGSFVSGGFKAPGSEPLKICHNKLRKILSKVKGRKLRPFELHLMSCIIADAVISGGIRRSAMISIFDIDDEEMLQCKTGDWFLTYPELCRCNNSVAIYEDTPKEKYDKIFEYIQQYGEPGLLFMPDTEAVINPCAEALLYPMYINSDGSKEYGWSFCNLCEINGKKIETEQDFYKACRTAAILGTFQAAYTENLPLLSEATKKIMERDALLGVGITGMADNPRILFNERIQINGARIVKETNKEVANILGINEAARTTVIKPSGNASQLLGCVPADTPILTENGIKRFDEVKVGEKVWSYNKEKEAKELKSVIATHNVIVKSEDQIKISGLFGSIITSKKHPLLVFREGKWEYLPAGMLKIGDVIQKGIFQSKEISFNKKAYLVGLFLGDGCAYYNKKGDQLIIEMLGDNKEVIDKFTEIMNEYSCCNFNTKEYHSEKYSVPVWYNRFHLGLNNPLVKDWFNLVEIEVGKKSDKIKIPSWIKKSYDISIVFSFLAGLIDSDGWIDLENGSIHYGTASKLMKDDLLEYLPLFGIYPWAHVSETKTYTYEGFKPNFDFNVISFSLLGNDLKSFASFLSHSKKREGLLSKKEILIKRKLVIPRELIKNEADYIFSEVKNSSKRWAFVDSANKGMYVRANYYTKQNKDFSHIIHYDRIVAIEDDLDLDENFKDITVEDNHSYIVGYGSQYVSHNCGSGIHAYHFKKYIRNIQANNNEQALKEILKVNSEISNPSFWNKKNETVLSFPIELDDKTMVRTDFSTLDFLYRIYTTEKGWIMEGTNKEHPSSILKPKYHHNISCTVSVRDNEWKEIADWIWEHREGFCGLSFLPETGDLDYPQAPYTSYLNEKELVETYRQGAILSSGLIVDGLQVFGDIWTACNAATGKADDLLTYTDEYLLSFIKKHMKDGKLLINIDGLYVSDVNVISSHLQHKVELRNDWVRRFKKFSKNHFNGDDKKCSCCLKHVNIFHQWQKIKNQKPVDWENVQWEQEYKNVGENVATACSGGACELR